MRGNGVEVKGYTGGQWTLAAVHRGFLHVRHGALAGARMERHGAPAHPGGLLWVARWGGRTVLGMPTCGMFSQATPFDLVLPRLIAGEGVDNHALAGLGNGGLLLRDMAFRFPPCRANAARGELE